jgi:hypothetical protein
MEHQQRVGIVPVGGDPFGPPIGLRMRLHADYDPSRLHGAAPGHPRGLARAKNDLDQLKTLRGGAFRGRPPGPTEA